MKFHIALYEKSQVLDSNDFLKINFSLQKEKYTLGYSYGKMETGGDGVRKHRMIALCVVPSEY